MFSSSVFNRIKATWNYVIQSTEVGKLAVNFGRFFNKQTIITIGGTIILKDIFGYPYENVLRYSHIHTY